MIIPFLIAFGLGYIISLLFMKAALHASAIATGFGAASFIIWGTVYFFKGLLKGLKG